MIRAAVRWFDDQGWGVLGAPEALGGVFAHCSDIDADGYRTLRAGQAVDVELERPLAFDQDGRRYPGNSGRSAGLKNSPCNNVFQGTRLDLSCGTKPRRSRSRAPA
jgi:cold shock protein